MRTPLRLATVLAVVLLTASACALSSEGPGASQTPATPAPTTPATSGATGSGTASPSAGVSAALPDDLRTRPAVVEALADAARRAAVAPDQVVVAAWSEVTWTDGSLGCPQKDVAYTQALVEGELLILRVAGRLFQYHARTGGSFGYCATPSAGYSVG